MESKDVEGINPRIINLPTNEKRPELHWLKSTGDDDQSKRGVSILVGKTPLILVLRAWHVDTGSDGKASFPWSPFS